MNLNQTNIIGRWTKDLTFNASGSIPVAKGTLAVDGKPKKDGTKTTSFIPVVLFGKIAENTVNYCGSKGNKIRITGHLQSGSYHDKKHEEVIHYTLDLIADDTEFLETKKSSNTEQAAGYTEDEHMTPVDDGDLPF